MELTQQQTHQLEFANNLTKAILGKSLNDFEAHEVEEVAQKCIDLFTDYVSEYLETKYGKKDAIRFKATISNEKMSAFGKFPEFDTHFDEAYDSFIQMLETEIINN